MFKTMIKKVKKFAGQIKATATSLMIAAMTMPVFAGQTAPSVTVQPGLDVTTMTGKIAGGLLKILSGIGLIFIVWGGFQFAMALRDEDAAAKSRAILVLISGVCMAGLEAMLRFFNIIV